MIIKRFEMDIKDFIDRINNKINFSKEEISTIDEKLGMSIKIHGFNYNEINIEFSLINENKNIKIRGWGNDKCIIEDPKMLNTIIQTKLIYTKDNKENDCLILLKLNLSEKSDNKGVQDRVFTYCESLPESEYRCKEMLKPLFYFEDATVNGIITLVYYYASILFYKKGAKLKYFFDESYFKDVISKKADYLGLDYKKNKTKDFGELIKKGLSKDEIERAEILISIINLDYITSSEIVGLMDVIECRSIATSD